MYNNTYTVNRTNNSFRVVSRYGANGTLTQQNGISTLKSIPRGNYRTCGDIAQAFAEVVRATVEADARTATGDNTLTAVVTGVSGPNVEPSPNDGFSIGDRLLKFKITTSVPHTLTSIKIECLERLGESFALLGGNRLRDEFVAGTLVPSVLGENSLSSTTNGAQGGSDIIIMGLYPMQRSTEPQIYLRCDLPNDNIETASLNKIVRSGAGFDGDSSLSSNILGVFQKEFEFIHYDVKNDEFILNLRSRSLSHIRLYLTDSKNRRVETVGFGDGTQQAKFGNLSFSCILRIDTIQANIPRQLQVTPQPLPDLKETGVLKHLNPKPQ